MSEIPQERTITIVLRGGTDDPQLAELYATLANALWHQAQTAVTLAHVTGLEFEVQHDGGFGTNRLNRAWDELGRPRWNRD